MVIHEDSFDAEERQTAIEETFSPRNRSSRHVITDTLAISESGA